MMANEPAEDTACEGRLALESLPVRVGLTRFSKLYSSMCVISKLESSGWNFLKKRIYSLI